MRSAWVFIVLLGLAAPAFADVTADWETVVSKPGRFSIKFPDSPTESIKQIDSPYGKSTVTILTTDLGNAQYIVTFIDMPKGAPSRSAKAKLDLAQEGAISKHGLKVVTQKDKTLFGYPARDLELVAGDQYLRIRLLIVGRRLYTVFGTSSSEDALPSGLDAFVTSFRLK